MRTSNLQPRTSNLELPTSNRREQAPFDLFPFQCSTFNVRRSVFDVQCSTFSVRRSVFDVRCSTFSVRRSMFDVQHSTFDVQRRTFAFLPVSFNVRRPAVPPSLSSLASWIYQSCGIAYRRVGRDRRPGLLVDAPGARRSRPTRVMLSPGREIAERSSSRYHSGTRRSTTRSRSSRCIDRPAYRRAGTRSPRAAIHDLRPTIRSPRSSILYLHPASRNRR